MPDDLVFEDSGLSVDDLDDLEETLSEVRQEYNQQKALAAEAKRLGLDPKEVAARAREILAADEKSQS